MLLGSGCALFHRNPPLPAIIIPQPPLIFPAPPPAPVPPPEVLAPAPAPAPDWQLALDLGAPPPLPPRRAPAAPKPVPAPAPAAPPPPLLNSGLSPAQQEAYRGNTSAILQRVQNDLKILQQRTLTGSAAATRAQAAEYVRQAQQALTQGDLVRAGTLAGKAETLARFLLGE